MKLKSLILVFIWCTAIIAQIASGDFFLAEYLYRDIDSRINLSLTPINLNADAVVYNVIPGNIPITYNGTCLKPFALRSPLVQKHSLTASVTGRSISAGLRLQGEIQKTRFREDNEGKDPTGSAITEPISFTDLNHTRTSLAAIANISIPISAADFTLSLGGDLIQHYGYTFEKFKHSRYQTEYHIRDYEPADLSSRVTAGLMVTIPWQLLGSPMLNLISIHGTSQNEKSALRAPSSLNAGLLANDVYYWYSSQTTIRNGQLQLSARPLMPTDRSKQGLLYSGFFLYGMRIAEASIHVALTNFLMQNTRCMPLINSDSTALFSWMTGYRTITYSMSFCPEFFITSWLSITPKASAYNAIEYRDVDPHEFNQLFTGLDLTGSLKLNIYNNLTPETYLIVSVESGEWTTPASFLEKYNSQGTSRYKEYLLGLNITLVGLK